MERFAQHLVLSHDTVRTRPVTGNQPRLAGGAQPRLAAVRSFAPPQPSSERLKKRTRSLGQPPIGSQRDG